MHFFYLCSKIFKGPGWNLTSSFGKVICSKSMNMVFVASIIAHRLRMIYAFFYFFCSKIIFDQKLFPYCWEKYDFPGSIVYLSCFWMKRPSWLLTAISTTKQITFFRLQNVDRCEWFGPGVPSDRLPVHVRYRDTICHLFWSRKSENKVINIHVIIDFHSSFVVSNLSFNVVEIKGMFNILLLFH